MLIWGPEILINPHFRIWDFLMETCCFCLSLLEGGGPKLNILLTHENTFCGFRAELRVGAVGLSEIPLSASQPRGFGHTSPCLALPCLALHRIALHYMHTYTHTYIHIHTHIHTNASGPADLLPVHRWRSSWVSAHAQVDLM